MFKKRLLIIAGLIFAAAFSFTAQAKSQCSGLSKSVCAVNDTCTWRKSSVDKNGKKTKAHCRALPGKSKAKKSSAKSSAQKATKKSSTKATSKASKKTADKKSVKKKAEKSTKKKSTNQKSTKKKSSKSSKS